MIESIKRMYGSLWDGREIMVYGVSSCDYLLISNAFEKIGQCTAYTFSIGLEGKNIEKLYKIVQINSHYNSLMFEDATRRTARVCKTAITNIVLLNYVRLEQNQSIVPILFCMEMQGKKKPLTIEMLTNKTAPGQRKIITASEVRRAYKHCTDPGLSEKVKLAAQMTFRFVRVKRLLGGEEPYQLSEVPAPWEHPFFQSRIAARMAGRQNEGDSNWRRQFNELVEEYDRTKVY